MSTAVIKFELSATAFMKNRKINNSIRTTHSCINKLGKLYSERKAMSIRQNYVHYIYITYVQATGIEVAR